MIAIPFSSVNFASEMKPKISGANLNLDYENIASSIDKVAEDIIELLSRKVYLRLLDIYNKKSLPEKIDDLDILNQAVDYLQRAMLHFAIYEHSIFLIAQIKNDGITVKKTDDQTTIFKYQQDELNLKLITTAWFWINRLIKLMNENLGVFTEWKESDVYKKQQELPVDLSDFNTWVGVAKSGGEYFMISAGWIIREVWIDCVKPRFEKEAEIKKTDNIARAVCYEVLGRACERLAYSVLPEPIRKDIDNEMGKNHREKSDIDIKERVSKIFISKAAIYWSAVDLEIKATEIANQGTNASSEPIIGKPLRNEDDKFVCM
jgi:hypothetical protein